MQPGPHGNIETMIKLRSQLCRIDSGHGKRENRTAAGGISRAMDRHPGNSSQCLFRLEEQRMFMLVESRKAQFRDEFDSSLQAGDTGEIMRSGFKTVRHDLRLFFSG